jgi:hypothetical protein
MANVEIQQAKLNELFAGTGMAELIIDGISGSVTRQRLCAARLGLGLPPSARSTWTPAARKNRS